MTERDQSFQRNRVILGEAANPCAPQFRDMAAGAQRAGNVARSVAAATNEQVVTDLLGGTDITRGVLQPSLQVSDKTILTARLLVRLSIFAGSLNMVGVTVNTARSAEDLSIGPRAGCDYNEGSKGGRSEGQRKPPQP